ncbi:MAG TPA: DUF4337 family protein [Candidatus Limnocylindrales bacterium]|nr:DUF4337 family protein [Candidatus Limnocylindrales bacterium]
MNSEELAESTEHAHHQGEKGVGLTTAIVAVLLAMATLLGHRAHTEEIKLQTKVNDGWGFYQAKHGRAHQYGVHAEDDVLANHKEVALKNLKVSIEEECGAPAEEGCTSPAIKDSAILQELAKELKSPSPMTDAAFDKGAAADPASEKPHKKPARVRKEGAVDIQDHTRELEKETEFVTRQANFYDTSELFLEISIVLCSITLLAETRLYWKLSFVSTAIGIAVAVYGMALR